MSSDTDAALRLRTALELADLAEQMMEQSLRRARPEADDDEIRRALGRWFRTRPGAEFGDCPGRPVLLPRST